jgi:hypothetical protein
MQRPNGVFFPLLTLYENWQPKDCQFYYLFTFSTACTYLFRQPLDDGLEYQFGIYIGLKSNYRDFRKSHINICSSGKATKRGGASCASAMMMVIAPKRPQNMTRQIIACPKILKLLV